MAEAGEAREPGGPALRRRLRVALVSYGFGELIFALARGLADHADVLLVTSEEHAAPNLAGRDERVELWAPPMPRLRQAAGQIAFQRRAIREIQRFRPDVVHIQSGHPWFNLFLHRLRRLPVVITIHDPRTHLGDRASQKAPQAVYDYGFRRADLVIVHVPQMVEPVVSEIGVAADRVRVVPHVAIGDETLAPDVAEEPGTLLFFGRIWPYKGLDVLIRAQPKITAAVPEARIIVAGQGEDFDRYRALMADPGRFEVHNSHVPAQLQAEVFRRSSVVVLPYLEATQSGVVVNAYAYHKPVVATAVGGLVAQVDHGRTGLLVPPNDVDALAEAVIELLSDPGRRRAMGEAGHDRLTGEWSIPEVAARTLDVYHQAIDRHRAERPRADGDRTVAEPAALTPLEQP